MDIPLYLHVIGATVLLGTGAGIAFFMVLAVQTGDAKLIAHVGRSVVIADFVFTATAVIAQPITGTLLALDRGYPLLEGWVLVSLGLYVFTGIFWLPVVYIQAKLADIARAAATAQTPLPRRFYRLYRIWFACGFPAFAAVLAIIWLMLEKPELAIRPGSV
jgi:uncharacterized membrane protein